MGLFSWFRRKPAGDDSDFESILSGLETSIRAHEEALAFIKQREHRAVVLFTSYSTCAWLVYVLAWWFGALDYGYGAAYAHDEEHDAGQEELELLSRALKTLPVGAVPILIFFTRRIVKWWYRRKQEAENKQLTALRKRQRDQLDKLKKLSNYDKVTEMLERHGQLPPRSPAPNAFGTPAGKARPGSASAFSTPVGRGQGSAPPLTPAQQQQQALAAARQNASRQQGAGPGAGAGAGKTGFPAPPPAFGRPGQLPATPGAGRPYPAGPQEQLPPQHFQKGFIDRIAEALLGGPESEDSPASKYALICQRCFSHNGLCLKDEILDIQFICSKCGFLNPSRRARMTGGMGGAVSAVPSAPAEAAAAEDDAVADSATGRRPSAAAQGSDSESDDAMSEADGEDTPDARREGGPTVETSTSTSTSRVKEGPRKANLRSRRSGKSSGNAGRDGGDVDDGDGIRNDVEME